MPAAAEGHTLRIGTLDCDAHRQLCRQAGVNRSGELLEFVGLELSLNYSSFLVDLAHPVLF